ncbi:MAG: hypothetical protein PVH25_11550 [Burkholderiales bacterium]|jgi:hypothetical protein
MWWAVAFWIVYGVGSTFFVVYLFRLGRPVATNVGEPVHQEIERIRQSESCTPEPPIPGNAHFSFCQSQQDPAERLHVERIYHPDAQYVAVQGVRNGTTCVINLPVGKAVDMLATEPQTGACTEKAASEH